MTKPIDPDTIKLVLTFGEFGLWAFLAFLAAITIIYGILFWKGGLSNDGIAMVIQHSDAPRFATIVIILVSATVLAVLGIIDGEAVVALLSGIAGYVLGNRAKTGSQASVKPPA